MKYILKFGFSFVYFDVVFASLLRGTHDRNECCLVELWAPLLKCTYNKCRHPTPHVCSCEMRRYLGQRQRVGMSRQGQLHGGLPDPWVMQPLGRDHELDGLGQVGHVLLGVHRPIGPHAEVGVTGHEPHLPATLAVLELHWGGGEKREQN